MRGENMRRIEGGVEEKKKEREIKWKKKKRDKRKEISPVLQN